MIVKCKNCGANFIDNGSKYNPFKSFCTNACEVEYRRDKGYDTHGFEFDSKIKPLMEKAKAGDAKANLELRLRYNVTSVWNGRELISTYPVDFFLVL